MRGLSQQALANAIGEAQSTVGCWESGRGAPRYRTLLKLADYLHVSLDYLTGRSNHFSSNMELSEAETQLVYAYRKLNPAEKKLVCKMLEIPPSKP